MGVRSGGEDVPADLAREMRQALHCLLPSLRPTVQGSGKDSKDPPQRHEPQDGGSMEEMPPDLQGRSWA